MNYPEDDTDPFDFARGLIVAVCITASCAGFAALLHYLF